MLLHIKNKPLYIILLIILQIIFHIFCESILAANNDNELLLPSMVKIKDGKGKQLPDSIAIFDENRNKVFFDSFDGKALLISFWATWCSSCLKEIPELDALQKDFRKLAFKVIAVSEDFQGVEVVKKYFVTEEIRHLTIYHDYKNNLFNALEVVGLPTSFLVDSEGKIIKIFTGPVNWYDDNIRNILLEHIPGNPVKPNNSYQNNVVNQLTKRKSAQTPNKAENTKDTNDDVKNDDFKKEDDKPVNESNKTSLTVKRHSKLVHYGSKLKIS